VGGFVGNGKRSGKKKKKHPKEAAWILWVGFLGDV